MNTSTPITKVTLPIVGNVTSGFCYNTGKPAVQTDQSGNRMYQHYADPLDRFSQVNLFCLSWKWSPPPLTERREHPLEKARGNYPAEEKVAILRRHLVEKEPFSEQCGECQRQTTVFYRWPKQSFETKDCFAVLFCHGAAASPTLASEG